MFRSVLADSAGHKPTPHRLRYPSGRRTLLPPSGASKREATVARLLVNANAAVGLAAPAATRVRRTVAAKMLVERMTLAVVPGALGGMTAVSVTKGGGAVAVNVAVMERGKEIEMIGEGGASVPEARLPSETTTRTSLEMTGLKLLLMTLSKFKTCCSPFCLQFSSFLLHYAHPRQAVIPF